MIEAFHRETAVIIADNKLIDVYTGTRYGVSANFFNIKKNWNENKFTSLTFIHTHPDHMCGLSDQDHTMIKTWSWTFDIPIISILLYRTYEKQGIILNSKVYVSKMNYDYTCVELGQLYNENNILIKKIMESSLIPENTENIPFLELNNILNTVLTDELIIKLNFMGFNNAI